MKIQNLRKKQFIKKIFIKICRILGYEIIDHNNLYIPTSDKFATEELSKPGKRSISVPLGEVKITRQVKNLDIIIKTCTGVKLVSQSKERVFEHNKSEYTFRSINSVIRSVNYAKKEMPNIVFNIFVIDHSSCSEDLSTIKNLLENSNISFKIINLNIDEFSSKINKKNTKGENVTENMIATMSSIYKSFLLAKEKCNDLVYFVEDDYVHQIETIKEMIFSYERISSQINRDFIICPSDYPFLYNKVDKTEIYLGNKRHWRKTEETLLTFMISMNLLNKHWNLFEKMCQFENSPFEEPLHKIYQNELCLSPIPSLAMHCTNVNSVFGLPPNYDWKKVWEENKNYKND